MSTGDAWRAVAFVLAATLASAAVYFETGPATALLILLLLIATYMLLHFALIVVRWEKERAAEDLKRLAKELYAWIQDEKERRKGLAS